MKSIYQTCIPRQAVLDGTADFVVNLCRICQSSMKPRQGNREA